MEGLLVWVLLLLLMLANRLNDRGSVVQVRVAVRTEMRKLLS